MHLDLLQGRRTIQVIQPAATLHLLRLQCIEESLNVEYLAAQLTALLHPPSCMHDTLFSKRRYKKNFLPKRAVTSGDPLDLTDLVSFRQTLENVLTQREDVGCCPPLYLMIAQKDGLFMWPVELGSYEHLLFYDGLEKLWAPSLKNNEGSILDWLISDLGLPRAPSRTHTAAEYAQSVCCITGQPGSFQAKTLHEQLVGKSFETNTIFLAFTLLHTANYTGKNHRLACDSKNGGSSQPSPCVHIAIFCGREAQAGCWDEVLV